MSCVVTLSTALLLLSHPRPQHIYLTDGASPGVRIMINAIIRDRVRVCVCV
jgi:hypothetical protein